MMNLWESLSLQPRSQFTSVFLPHILDMLHSPLESTLRSQTG